MTATILRIQSRVSRRGGRVAEGTRLLSEYRAHARSRVRIPPSPLNRQAWPSPSLPGGLTMALREVGSGPDVPATIGPYSPAVRVGDLLFVSGQAGVDPATGEPAGDTFSDQARQVFRNLDAVLQAGGSQLSQVANTTSARVGCGRLRRAERAVRRVF